MRREKSNYSSGHSEQREQPPHQMSSLCRDTAGGAVRCSWRGDTDHLPWKHTGDPGGQVGGLHHLLSVKLQCSSGMNTLYRTVRQGNTNNHSHTEGRLGLELPISPVSTSLDRRKKPGVNPHPHRHRESIDSTPKGPGFGN